MSLEMADLFNDLGKALNPNNHFQVVTIANGKVDNVFCGLSEEEARQKYATWVRLVPEVVDAVRLVNGMTGEVLERTYKPPKYTGEW